MKTKICKKCGNEFNLRCIVNNELYTMYTRSYCLNCSPLDISPAIKLCTNCGEEFNVRQIKNGKLLKLYDRNQCLNCMPYCKEKNIRTKLKNNKLNSIQEQIFNGHMLGDGYLSKRPNDKNAKFGILRATQDLEYLQWSAEYFNEYLTTRGIKDSSFFDSRTNKIYYRSDFYTRSLPVFTEYYNKWYPEGYKIIPTDLTLTPMTIAIWLCDDGCITKTKKALTIAFSTDCFPKSNVVILKNKLIDLYGGRIRIQERSYNPGKFQIYISHTPTSIKIINDIKNIFPNLNRKSDKWAGIDL